MATYNAGAGRGKQGGPTAKELSEYNYEDVLDERYRKKIKENEEYKSDLRADIVDARKLESQMYGGKVYMGDANAKPMTQQEVANFEKNSSYDIKTNPLIAITNKVGPAVERGLDTALPLRKFANMAVAATTANISKKQYDDQVAAFESMPKEEQDRDRLRTRAVKPMKKGGKVMSASSRADGIAKRGKTRGMVK